MNPQKMYERREGEHSSLYLCLTKGTLANYNRRTINTIIQSYWPFTPLSPKYNNRSTWAHLNPEMIFIERKTKGRRDKNLNKDENKENGSKVISGMWKATISISYDSSHYTTAIVNGRQFEIGLFFNRVEILKEFVCIVLHVFVITKTIQVRRTRHAGHIAGEARTNSSVMYSYGPTHMAEQKQDDQLEHTYSSNVRIRDVALKTCQKQWMIGKSGERGSGISVLAAWHDDDDDMSSAMII